MALGRGSGFVGGRTSDESEEGAILGRSAPNEVGGLSGEDVGVEVSPRSFSRRR